MITAERWRRIRAAAAGHLPAAALLHHVRDVWVSDEGVTLEFPRETPRFIEIAERHRRPLEQAIKVFMGDVPVRFKGPRPKGPPPVRMVSAVTPRAQPERWPSDRVGHAPADSRWKAVQARVAGRARPRATTRATQPRRTQRQDSAGQSVAAFGWKAEQAGVEAGARQRAAARAAQPRPTQRKESPRERVERMRAQEVRTRLFLDEKERQLRELPRGTGTAGNNSWRDETDG